MSDTREQQIRERAFALWEEQGRPEGRHHDHWQQAAGEVAAVPDAPSPASAAIEAPPAPKRRTTKAAAPAAEPVAKPAPKRRKPAKG